MSEQRGAWVIRAGRGDDNHAADFRETGVVAVGFRPVGDLAGMSQDQIRSVVDERWSDRPQGTRIAYTYQLDAFANVIRPGDIVLTPLGPGTHQVLVGVIEGPYEHADEALIENWQHSRRTRWLRTVPEDTLPASVRGPLQSSRTITPIREVDALESSLGVGDADAIHLLLKWRVSEEPRTIDLHREIADRRGSVWWGKIGDPDGRSAMSGTYLDHFREQLRESTPTHVYLYRAGDLWRADLVEITADESAIDRSMVPQYYGSTQHNLWVKNTNFTSLPADWPLTNLAPAGGSSQGMEASLNSRASLLYVRELNREAHLEPITWWVNQGQTYLQERDGGYMWAPKRSKGAGVGPRPYWTTMTEVRPGDRIAHYRNGAIRAVSRATSAAEDTTRPGELPAEAWEHEGWLVRTEYLELVNPLRLDAIPDT